MRKEPGGWGGDKGKRVITAAVGAAGINGLVDKDPGKGDIGSTIQSVMGGLLGNRLINGSRDDAEGSRSRSRSRGRDDGGGGGSKLAETAAGGLVAAAAKAFKDRSKSKDRGRRSYSSSSDDSRGKPRRRGKSVSDYMRQGMGALGIGGDKMKRTDSRDRGVARGGPDDHSPPRPRGGGSEGGGGNGHQNGNGNGNGNRNGVIKQPGQTMNRKHSDDSSSSSSSDSISSSEEERERKTLGRRQLITAGLASVATIHAAHSVYQSYEGRKTRRKELKEGEITPQEARKMKNKARLQDAASIGVAALGIKGAYSEWKEMKEQHHEVVEFDEKAKVRHERHQHKLDMAHEYGRTHGFGPNTHPPGQGQGPGPNSQQQDMPTNYGHGRGPANNPQNYPQYQQPQYPYPGADLPTGYYPTPPGSQSAGYYPEPGNNYGSGNGSGPTGPLRRDAPAIAHYADGNPYHTAGMPPPTPPEQQEPSPNPSRR